MRVRADFLSVRQISRWFARDERGGIFVGPVAKFFRARFVRELRSAEPASTRPEIETRPPKIPVRNQKLCHPTLSRGSHTGREKFATGPARFHRKQLQTGAIVA